MDYTVMHGAGNCFVLLDAADSGLDRSALSALAVRLCAKEQVDGMIAVVGDPDADFRMVFINSDGSFGEMCGNGARCVARWAVEHGWAPDPDKIRFYADAGLILARRITESEYQVRLNDPSVCDLHREVPAAGHLWDCAYIELGDPGIPHAVVQVDESVFDAPDTLRELGRELRHAPAFPKGANVTFAALTGPSCVRAVTFERGVEDFTLACGTGSGATAVSFYLRGLVSSLPVSVNMPGGRLQLSFSLCGGKAHDLLLTGPTCVVRQGNF